MRNMHLFYNAVTTIILLCYLSDVNCVESQESSLGFTNAGRALRSSEVRSRRQACDCGEHSDGCHIANGRKICRCRYKYNQVDGLCQPLCQHNYHCDNGAPCVNNTCQCLPGTGGEFCTKVDECGNGRKGIQKCGDPAEVFCTYDEKRLQAVCRCRIFEYEYYALNKTCIECDCNKKYGNCSLIDGIKTCNCKPGYMPKKVAYGTKVECAPCDCGENSIGCHYPMEGNLYWKQVCDCEEGYAQADKSCHECDCGPHGNCSYELFRFYKICDCEDGYKPFTTSTEKYCKECDCGKNGNCSYDNDIKICKCNAGYADKDGMCVECDCGEKGLCSYEEGVKKCQCETGHEENNGKCIDINECLNPDTCKYDSVCTNTIGGYDCHCEEGYTPYKGDPKKHGCEDIDECQNEEMCSRENTTCTNSPGSYTCQCRDGYEPVTPHDSPIPAGCQAKQYAEQQTETSSSWNTVIIVIGVILALCIIGLGTAIFLKHRARRRFLQMGVPLQNVQ